MADQKLCQSFPSPLLSSLPRVGEGKTALGPALKKAHHSRGKFISLGASCSCSAPSQTPSGGAAGGDPSPAPQLPGGQHGLLPGAAACDARAISVSAPRSSPAVPVDAAAGVRRAGPAKAGPGARGSCASQPAAGALTRGETGTCGRRFPGSSPASHSRPARTQEMPTGQFGVATVGISLLPGPCPGPPSSQLSSDTGREQLASTSGTHC